jgi:hypothetical protein
MKTLTKKEIVEIHEKCVRLVKRKPAEFFQLKKMYKYEGSCNWTDLEIDYRRELLSTAYHECVHYLFPEYSETMVKYVESRIVNVCEPLDLAYFLKILSNKLYKSELEKCSYNKKKSLTYRKK